MSGITDVFIVTRQNYPTVFRGFQLLVVETGQPSDKFKNFAVPLFFEDKMEGIEKALSILTSDEFTCLVVGEDKDKQELLRKNVVHVQADELFQEIYEVL